nr:MAG TPA: hypothetical protein [Caudoviricetes sp.]
MLIAITSFFMYYITIAKEQKKQTFGHTETTQYNEDIRKRSDSLKNSSSRKKKSRPEQLTTKPDRHQSKKER